MATTSTASFTDAHAPTNKMMLKRAMQIFWVLILNMAEIRVSSLKYTHLLPTTMPSHPLSLSDHTFSELVFRGSDMVNIVSLVVILVIMTELVSNVSNEARRPINLYYGTCVRDIFLATAVLCLLRVTIAIHSECKMLGEILFTTLVLMLVAGLGCLFWSFLRRSEKKVFEVVSS